jgi:hypothetical protein
MEDTCSCHADDLINMIRYKYLPLGEIVVLVMKPATIGRLEDEEQSYLE